MLVPVLAGLAGSDIPIHKQLPHNTVHTLCMGPRSSSRRTLSPRYRLKSESRVASRYTGTESHYDTDPAQAQGKLQTQFKVQTQVQVQTHIVIQTQIRVNGAVRTYYTTRRDAKAEVLHQQSVSI